MVYAIINYSICHNSAFCSFRLLAKSVLYKVVLSAYKSTNIGEFCNESGKSLIESKNRRGPKMDPCGTPYMTFQLIELELLISTWLGSIIKV